MSKAPLLSFYIPVYQKPPEVFRNCLKSLFDQSLKDFEVIAVFDGPNPELEAVAKEFPKVQTDVIDHGGAPKARNRGLELSKGRYVVAWDADCRIKPHAAKRWLEEFEAIPDADFVYTGYEVAEGLPTFQSESFDAYSLTCGNYISTMSPIKRDKAPKWDESLKAGQDWDYWLTAVENGCKGVFIEGPAFITDTPMSGISSERWNMANRDNTIYTVRRKHGIPDREIGVFTTLYRPRAIKLAKILNADLIKSTGPTPTIYKMVFNLGYNFMSRFEDLAKDVVKVQYWTPGYIAGLAEARYSSVKETVRISKTVHNLCNTEYEKNKLKELDIDAEVVPLPLAEEDMAKVSHALPDEFKVLVDTDDAYAKLLKEIQTDLPHIKFAFRSAKTDDYSCFLNFHQFATLDNAMLIAHVNGRHVISNVQAPYCGFVDPELHWESFKKDLYEKIREVSHKPLNLEAQAYYLDFAHPDKFRARVNALLAPKLEVIA